MDKEIMSRVNDSNVDFNLYFTLRAVSEGLSLTHSRIEGWLVLASKKGLVSIINDQILLTEEGKTLLEYCKGMYKEEVVSSKATSSDQYVKLHEEIKAKILEYTGKKVNPKINGSDNYDFLCSWKELETRITKVMSMHKLTDFDRIRRILLVYTRKCAKLKFNHVRQMKYWILDQDRKSSDLATAYGTWTDAEIGIGTDTSSPIKRATEVFL